MLSAPTALPTAGNPVAASVPTSVHRHSSYTPPRSLGSSSGSSGRCSRASSRRGPPRTTARRGVDRKVPLPRERHDFRRSSSVHSLSDEETRISGFYGLMSLSNGSSSQQSSLSSVTYGTSLQEAVKQTKDVAQVAIMACSAEVEHENAAFASAMTKSYNDIQVTPATRTATVAIAPPAPPPTAAPMSYSYKTNDKRTASSSSNSFQTLQNLRSRANSSNSISTTGTSSKNMVEIAPGVSLPLRGAEETKQAIAAGFYVQCECPACPPTNNSNNENNLHCILDCSYFLCPDCRSVAPNPLKADNDGDGSASEGQGGLGMGFRLSQQNNNYNQQSHS